MYCLFLEHRLSKLGIRGLNFKGRYADNAHARMSSVKKLSPVARMVYNPLKTIILFIVIVRISYHSANMQIRRYQYNLAF